MDSTEFDRTPQLSGSTADAPNPWDGVRRVLVLQGGGALGAYQGGVYEALAQEGLRPDWVAGISIGAINAALIAGNPPERRVERLREFWELVSSNLTPTLPNFMDGGREAINEMSAMVTALFGAPGFFKPRNPMMPLLGAVPGLGAFTGADAAAAISLYDTSPLKATLERLIDFDLLNSGKVRLTVGAVNVLSGNSVIFDSAERRIGPEHIMASGALPPGLPPVMVDGEPYWDGGLVSNTPLEFVLDQEEEQDLIVFQVDLFNARGAMPRNLLEADEREKDIRFSSRTRMNTTANVRLHQAKTALRMLIHSLPPELRARKDVAPLLDLAKENAVTIVQLIYRKRPFEGGSKDYEFSRQTMLDHWASGMADIAHCARNRDALFSKPPKAGVTVIDPGLPD
jgi:NTE family protein